jgi:hypothetical protein
MVGKRKNTFFFYAVGLPESFQYPLSCTMPNLEVKPATFTASARAFLRLPEGGSPKVITFYTFPFRKNIANLQSSVKPCIVN